ncbi:hypothetical protein HPS174_0729 [Glaesserella parasuis 174]|uniref:Uncharacterized protein n=1 Tax=Glaesserella parasuis serovar 5 (strain SH0165) TaxID=557723 RepID=B8F5Q1_GLAP5|nr:hypothetical protein HAPS_1034 [Glaesserella parasuis SH0165]EQA13180.1 hypothetical protein HPS174_0729 [Glaesserella parasuis 174]
MYNEKWTMKRANHPFHCPFLTKFDLIMNLLAHQPRMK